jgi:hypothetical protein
VPRRVVRCAFLVLALAGISTFAVSEAEAQDSARDWTAPRWVGDVTFVSANALLGGLTAGLLQKIDGGDFRDGFARGALGGAVAYAGRRISVREFWGAGLLGRQVSAVGVSVARNAADARPSLDRLMFPVGPLRLYVDRSARTVLQPKLGVSDLAVLTWLALRSETRFDWSASVSAGAPVFRSPGRHVMSDGQAVGGVMSLGSVVLSDLPESRLRVTFPHERVHVLQHDFAFLLWNDPIEARLVRRNRVTHAFYRYLDFGVAFTAPASAVLSLIDLEHADQPWEIEATFLAPREP